MKLHIGKAITALVMGAFLLLTAFQCGSGWDEERNGSDGGSELVFFCRYRQKIVSLHCVFNTKTCR